MISVMPGSSFSIVLLHDPSIVRRGGQSGGLTDSFAFLNSLRLCILTKPMQRWCMFERRHSEALGGLLSWAPDLQCAVIQQLSWEGDLTSWPQEANGSSVLAAVDCHRILFLMSNVEQMPASWLQERVLQLQNRRLNIHLARQKS